MAQLIRRRGRGREIEEWDPLREFTALQRRMNRMFENLPLVSPFFITPETESLVPPVDMFEQDSEVVLRAQLPGVDKKNIDISVSEDEITIKAEAKKEEEIKEENLYRKEMSYGTFIRTLALPTEVQSEKAKAKLENGILEVRMPKSQKAISKEKKIKIE